MLNVYMEAAKIQRPSLFMDATGGVVRKVYDQRRAIFLVALVIRHPVAGEAQVPVALMLTNSYCTPDYTSFLHNWWWAILSCNKHALKPSSVTTDFNWPCMHAIALVFNGCDFIRYLKMCREILNNKLTDNEIECVTILGIGRAHFVHALVRWPEVKCSDASISLFWRLLLTGMIEITNWELMKVYLRHVFIILTAEQLSETADSLAYVQAFIDPNTCSGSSTAVASNAGSPDVTLSSETLYAQSPFFTEAQAIFDIVLADSALSNPPSVFSTPNGRRNVALARRFLHSVIPYVALWSAIMENPMRYAKDSSLVSHNCKFSGWREAFVEGFFRMLKHDIFNNDSLPVVVEDFITITNRSLKGRCIKFASVLPTTASVRTVLRHE